MGSDPSPHRPAYMASLTTHVRRSLEGGPEAPTVVVGVSGGADSVALLRLLTELPVGRLIAAHLDHGLRGAESEGDAAFVAQLCRRLGVEFRSAGIDLVAEAGAAGEGLEEAGRRLRYRWLTRVARAEQAQFLATGHHADDQAETVLHRLIRGTGLAGLRGIGPRRRLGPGLMLVRPLLLVTRAEILAYLAAVGQDYRVDSSNADPRFTRNALRHDLMPALARYNPRVAASLARLAEQAGEAHALRARQARRSLAALLLPGPGVRLDRAGLVRLRRGRIRDVFRRLWRVRGWPTSRMGREEWDRLADLALAQTERVITLPGRVRAGFRKREIWLEPPPAGD